MVRSRALPFQLATALAALSALAVLILSPAAPAAYPGGNGDVLFVGSRGERSDIYSHSGPGHDICNGGRGRDRAKLCERRHSVP